MLWLALTLGLLAEPLAPRDIGPRDELLLRDYGALRFDAADEAEGWEALSALEREASSHIPERYRVDRHILPHGAISCGMHTVFTGARLAKEAPDQDAYARAHAAWVNHYADAQAQLGEPVAAQGADRQSLIADRVRRDQYWRTRPPAPEGGTAPSFTRRFLWEMGVTAVCYQDADNLRLLEQLWREDAQAFLQDIYVNSDRGWLLVQHAPLAFQEGVLEAISASGSAEAFGAPAAFLEDRAAVREGRPQRFGTQGVCSSQGVWSPSPVDDPEGLDARRESLGLAPMAEHAPRMGERC